MCAQTVIASALGSEPILMPDLSPRPRGREIYLTLSGLMDVYLTDKEETQTGEAEHARQHVVWVNAFLSALEYMAEYPRQASQLLTEYRRAVGFSPPRGLTDEGMGYITRQLYPQSKTDPIDKLVELAKKYKESPETDTIHERPALDDGQLVWQDVEPNKSIFPRWDEEYEDWRHTS